MGITLYVPKKTCYVKVTMDRNFIAAKKGTKKLVMQYNDNLKYICSLCGSFLTNGPEC